VAAAKTPIVLIDRNPGSGTKAAGTLFFLGYPWEGSFQVGPNSAVFGYTNCPAGPPPAGTSGAVNNEFGYGTPNPACANYVAGNSGPGTGAAGFQDIYAKSSAVVVNDLQSCNTTNDLCIAILSADNAPYLNQVPANSGKNAYDFVSIDGTFVDTNNPGVDSLNDPNGAGSTFKKVIQGSYPFYYQVSVQQNTVNPPAANSFGAALEALLVPKLTSGASAIAGITQKAKFPVASPSIVLDPDTLGAVTPAPAAGTVVETRSAVSGSFPALSPFLYGATLTFNTDPL